MIKSAEVRILLLATIFCHIKFWGEKVLGDSALKENFLGDSPFKEIFLEGRIAKETRDQLLTQPRTTAVLLLLPWRFPRQGSFFLGGEITKELSLFLGK